MSRRFALGARNVCLVGENSMWDVSEVCLWPYGVQAFVTMIAIHLPNIYIDYSLYIIVGFGWHQRTL